jgi:hypothetical protein
MKSEKSVLDPQRVKFVLDQLTREERKEAIRGLALLARASADAMRKRQNKKPVAPRSLS